MKKRISIHENQQFRRDYNRMIQWCCKHDTSPKDWNHLGIGLQNMYVLASDYWKLIENRNKLMLWYKENHPDNESESKE